MQVALVMNRSAYSRTRAQGCLWEGNTIPSPFTHPHPKADATAFQRPSAYLAVYCVLRPSTDTCLIQLSADVRVQC